MMLTLIIYLANYIVLVKIKLNLQLKVLQLASQASDQIKTYGQQLIHTMPPVPLNTQDIIYSPPLKLILQATQAQAQ